MFHISEVIKDIENQQKRVLAILEEHALNGIDSWRVLGPNQNNKRKWCVYVYWGNHTRKVGKGPTMLDAMAQAAQLVENAKCGQSLPDSDEKATSSDND